MLMPLHPSVGFSIVPIVDQLSRRHSSRWPAEQMDFSQLVTKTWMERAEKNDAKSVANLYAEDAIIMPPGAQEPIVGRANIEKFVANGLQQARALTNYKIETTDAKSLSDTNGYRYGTWSADTPAGKHLFGYWLSVTEKEGPDWKIKLDTWNAPPAPPAQATKQ
jgi:ketosteroid isomerase-like protein